MGEISPFIPPTLPGGRPRKQEMRELLDAIFYVTRVGYAWRLLPHEFPPWQTVYHYFRAWRLSGLWERMRAALRERVRVRAGREAQPSASVIDSQTVKTTECGGEHGYDGWIKMSGRERHILVDTLGLLLKAKVHAADILDGARLLLESVEQVFMRLSHVERIWATGGRPSGGSSSSPAGWWRP